MIIWILEYYISATKICMKMPKTHIYLAQLSIRHLITSTSDDLKWVLMSTGTLQQIGTYISTKLHENKKR